MKLHKDAKRNLGYWNSMAEYQPGDIVSTQTCMLICIQTNTNKFPHDVDNLHYWNAISGGYGMKGPGADETMAFHLQAYPFNSVGREWRPTQSYYRNDMVVDYSPETRIHHAYVCVCSNIGTKPHTNSTVWKKIVDNIQETSPFHPWNSVKFMHYM